MNGDQLEVAGGHCADPTWRVRDTQQTSVIVADAMLGVIDGQLRIVLQRYVQEWERDLYEWAKHYWYRLEVLWEGRLIHLSPFVTEFALCRESAHTWKLRTHYAGTVTDEFAQDRYGLRQVITMNACTGELLVHEGWSRR